MADDIYRDEKKIQEIQQKIVNSLTNSYSNAGAGRGAITASMNENGRPTISFTNQPTHSIDKYLEQLDKDTGLVWKYFKDASGKPCIGAMIDGKYLDVELEGELDKSKEMNFQDAFDFEWALVQANPQLQGKTQVVPGEDWRIEITQSDLTYLEMPNKAIKYDAANGRIELPNQRAIDVVVVNEHEKSRNAAQTVESNTRRAAGGDALGDHREDNNPQQDVYEMQEQMGDVGINREKDLDPANIYDAVQKYQLNAQGEVVTAQADGANSSVDVRRWENREIETALKINKIWCNACCSAKGIEDDRGNQRELQCMQGPAGEIFRIALLGLQQNRSIDDILKAIQNAPQIQDKEGAANAFLNFAEGMVHLGGLNIEFTKSREEYIADMNPESEMDNSPVREMKGPGMPGYNPNNNGTQN